MQIVINYKRILVIFITALLVAQFYPRKLHTQQPEILNSFGKPSQNLLQLLQVTGIEHDGSLASIVEQMQAHWLRKPGAERWDILEQDCDEKDAIKNLFKKMGLVEEIQPAHKKYEYILWMGAAYPRVADRFVYLVQLFEQGIRFEQIVMLSGARPLTQAEIDNIKIDFNLQDEALLPVTEADAMKLVYEKTDMPNEMRNISLVVIDFPMKITENGNLLRPTTGDTIDLWLVSNPTPGRCLVVSNQPYVQYQNSVTQTLLPKTFVVESCGPQAVNDKIAVHLDNLARYLYQEKKRLNV